MRSRHVHQLIFSHQLWLSPPILNNSQQHWNRLYLWPIEKLHLIVPKNHQHQPPHFFEQYEAIALLDQDGPLWGRTDKLDQAELARGALDDLGSIFLFGIEMGEVKWGSGRDNVVGTHLGVKRVCRKVNQGSR